MNRDTLYKTLLTLMLVVLVLPLTSVNVLAASAGGITVRDGYVRGLPPGVRNTAAYMTLINRSDSDLVLTGAKTSAAESVGIHETVNKNGQMFMQPVASAVVPAGGKLELKSGGLHLMLTGLKKPLKSGDNVRLTLEFQDAFVLSLDLPVVSVLEE